MLKIGLTGGIGSGKSTVCRLFAERAVPIIDADIIAHDIVKPGEPALTLLARTFGHEILNTDGSLDRHALRAQVFQDERKRRQLEGLLHPIIRKRMQEQLKRLDSPYVILAIPLLLEKGWQGEVDRILVVDTTEDLQLSRTMERDRMDAQAVRHIMQAQATRQQRMAAADDIIHNNGDYDKLERQIEALHRNYLKLAAE
jgi:dephospho-CoA kinase